MSYRRFLIFINSITNSGAGYKASMHIQLDSAGLANDVINLVHGPAFSGQQLCLALRTYIYVEGSIQMYTDLKK